MMSCTKHITTKFNQFQPSSLCPQVTNFLVTSLGSYVSHHSFAIHAFCNISLRSNTAGQVKPMGSNIWLIIDKISRLVILAGTTNSFISQDNVSRCFVPYKTEDISCRCKFIISISLTHLGRRIFLMSQLHFCI